jgi:phosphatidylinositol-3-phosphatase
VFKKLAASLIALAIMAAGVIAVASPSSSAAVLDGPRAAGSRAISTSSPCGVAAVHPTWQHVITIVMENHAFSAVAGHSAYLNGLAAKCGLATHYSAVTHPSLPNYIALTSGGTQGITSDCTTCNKNVPSVFGQMGGSWKAYAESIPAVGYTGAHYGSYYKKHNPAAYYMPLATTYKTRAVGMAKLQTDLTAGTLPRFSFVTPNICNDEHDCTVAVGDVWLKTWMPRILASPNYQAGNTAVVITYDEGSSSSNVVYTVVVSPSTRAGVQVAASFTHYSLLGAEQSMLGVPCLGASCSSAAASETFRSSFGL